MSYADGNTTTANVLATLRDVREACCQVVIASSEVDAARVIRVVAERACVESKVWSRTEWLNRAWLDPELSKVRRRCGHGRREVAGIGELIVITEKRAVVKKGQ